MERLSAYVASTPDAYLAEMAEVFQCSIEAIRKALKKLKITRKKDNKVQRAERAELLGAIRLPNNAFKQSANTDVTTDIIFLKKRNKIIDATEENWIYTGYYNTGRKTENGSLENVPLNQYFIDNPHMMLGKMHFDKSMYDNDKETALFPFSKPNDGELSKEEFFTKRFEELNQKFAFTPEQKVNLRRFETYAKQHTANLTRNFLKCP